MLSGVSLLSAYYTTLTVYDCKSSTTHFGVGLVDILSGHMEVDIFLFRFNNEHNSRSKSGGIGTRRIEGERYVLAASVS